MERMAKNSEYFGGELKEAVIASPKLGVHEMESLKENFERLNSSISRLYSIGSDLIGNENLEDFKESPDFDPTSYLGDLKLMNMKYSNALDKFESILNSLRKVF